MLKALGLKALPCLPEIPFLLSRTRGLYRFQEINFPTGPLLQGKMPYWDARFLNVLRLHLAICFSQYSKKSLHSLSGNFSS